MHSQPIPAGLCQCGCGEQTKLATKTQRDVGRIKGQPMRYVAGHQRRKSAAEYAIRDCGYRTPCWVWTRAVSRGGYGSLWRDGAWFNAHVWMYERHVGPVPDGLELDHLCRNRACCNPAHLEAVTHAENMRRSGPAIKTHCVNGHPRTPENSVSNGAGLSCCKICKNERRRTRRAIRR